MALDAAPKRCYNVCLCGETWAYSRSTVVSHIQSLDHGRETRLPWVKSITLLVYGNVGDYSLRHMQGVPSVSNCLSAHRKPTHILQKRTERARKYDALFATQARLCCCRFVRQHHESRAVTRLRSAQVRMETLRHL